MNAARKNKIFIYILLKIHVHYTILKLLYFSYIYRYDEQRPQVLYYRMENPRITLSIFYNGKINLLGQCLILILIVLIM